MLKVDLEYMKLYIKNKGIKQKFIAKEIGIEANKLSLSLIGKRKLEVGEYAGICKVINAPMETFIKDEGGKKNGIS